MRAHYYAHHPKRWHTLEKRSATLDAVLAYIYRKEHLRNRCGRYAKSVIDGLEKIGLVKKVESKKGIYYFSTDKSRNFKAIDFAKEFLLAFHNTEFRDGNKILVFDGDIPNGSGLIEVTEAIKQGYV